MSDYGGNSANSAPQSFKLLIPSPYDAS